MEGAIALSGQQLLLAQGTKAFTGTSVVSHLIYKSFQVQFTKKKTQQKNLRLSEAL